MTHDELPIQLDTDLDAAEAAKTLADRVSLSPKEYHALEEKYRSLAFTVSGYTAAEVIQTFRDRLAAAIEQGTTFQNFKQDILSYLTGSDQEVPHPWRLETIWQTNLQTAYNAGAYQEMTRPAVLKARPYWMYDIVDDERTRPSHRAMAGKVYRADDPVWDTWYPPNGFGCRCGVVSLSRRQVEQQGLTIEDKVPPMEPDVGFTNNPAAVPWSPDLSKLSPELVEAYRARLAAQRP